MAGITIGVGTGSDATVKDSITVSQDVGGPYPMMKRVTLDLMSDGTVRWRDVKQPGE